MANVILKPGETLADRFLQMMTDWAAETIINEVDEELAVQLETISDKILTEG